jgi:lipopolysaccharide export system protein LptC
MYAQRGFITEDGKHAYFHDNVRLVREARGKHSELTVNTSYLHIIPEENYVETDKPLVIQDAHTLINAVGLKLDKNKHQLKLLSRVKARYAPPSR